MGPATRKIGMKASQEDGSVCVCVCVCVCVWVGPHHCLGLGAAPPEVLPTMKTFLTHTATYKVNVKFLIGASIFGSWDLEKFGKTVIFGVFGEVRSIGTLALERFGRFCTVLVKNCDSWSLL